MRPGGSAVANMSATDIRATIGPAAYAAWRATSLGAGTEAIERRSILDLMGEISGARILDVGCGDGTLVFAAAAKGARVTGIDPDPAMLSAARARATEAGLPATFIEARVERLPFADASFDIVASVTVLCFVSDAAGAVAEMARVLRPGGQLVLGELGRWSVWAALRRVRSWLGSSTWRAARFRSAGELRALAGGAGLSVTSVRGAVFYPPVRLLARALAPVDPWLGCLTTLGAAFIALHAVATANDRRT